MSALAMYYCNYSAQFIDAQIALYLVIIHSTLSFQVTTQRNQ